MLQPWPAADPDRHDAEAEAEVAWMQGVIVATRTIRGEAQLGPAKELDILIRNATEADRSRLERNAPLLQKLAKLASVTLIEAADETPAALSALYEHLEILVPMAGIIDVEAETSRLNRDLQKHLNELERLQQKLANPNFTDRAPPEVVENERVKARAASDACDKITAQLSRLEGLH
jgi:valyl-tRNA synthetase